MTEAPGGVSPLLDHDPAEAGPYRLIGRLGSGGMGVVYAGLAATGERVAVKVVHPELAHDQEFRARFAREVTLLEKVRGACIVRMLDADANAARPWLATEYVPGPTLEAHMRGHGPLAGDELHGVASGLAEALVSMHAAGVVHRDLKPANVILSPSGPRVVDLGIARAVDEAGVTRTGVLIGSPAWLSPEHYGDGEVGPATDVHAWGLLVAFAATGRLPFGSGRPEVLAVRVLQEEVDLAGLDPALSAIASKALIKDPGERPSAAELLAAVTEAWRGHVGTGTDDLSDANAATALIERTWVMPNVDDPAWAAAVPSPEPLPGKPVRRRTRTLIATGVAVTAVAATAAMVGLRPSHRADEKARGGRVADTPKAVAATGATSAATTHAAPTADGSPSATVSVQGSRISINGGISAIVPTGWTAQSGVNEVGPYLCILMPGAHEGCMRDGVLIESWTDDLASQPGLGATDAWAGDVDPSALPPECFSPNGPDPTGITSASVSDARLRKLGSRSAIFRQYQISCGPNFSFRPEIWWLPKTRLMMTVVALPDRYRQTADAIAASIRFS
ncbi:MAG: serine/threonine-protein kinase [Actinoallomurus sp.]